MRRTLAAPLAGAAVVLAAAVAPAQQTAPQPLVAFEVANDGIARPLTGRPGDPQRGRQVIASRTLGNCIACHQISVMQDEPFHGNTGPSLDGVAGRYTEGELRLRIVDATRINENTMMPAFYRTTGLNKVLPQFLGRPILTAEQVEDVVAFLMTLH